MKKIFAILLMLSLLSGCALTTIKPYKKGVKPEPAPTKKSFIQSIIKPVQKPVVEAEDEEIK